MKGKILFTTALLLLIGWGQPAWSAVKSCTDITFKQDALERYPQIAEMCEEVLVLDNGEEYIKFSGTVERPGKNNMRVRFKAIRKVITVYPPKGMKVKIKGHGSVSPQNLQRGQELSFYVLRSRLAEPEIDYVHFNVAELGEELMEVDIDEDQQVAQNLPNTASPLPLFALLGLIFLVVGGVLHRMRGNSAQ